MVLRAESLLFLIFIKFILTSSQMEYATSIAVMTQLLSMEKDLIENLSDYAKLMQEKMDTINLALRTLRLEHHNQSTDPEEFLSNPLNSFALMRRMYLDWPKYYEFMKEPIGQDKIDFFKSFEDKLPDAEDFKEAESGLFRLLVTYNMKEIDMARGFLHGKQYNTKFSVLDCFVMGKYLKSRYLQKDSLRWFEVALELYEASYAKLYEIHGVTLAEIWFMIADQFSDLDDNKKSIEAIDRALALSPKEERFIDFKIKGVNSMNHERLCNGRTLMKTEKHLHCRYNGTTHPYLILGPLKMEELSLDPYVVLYRSIVYDSEIEKMRSDALPKFQEGELSDDEEHSNRIHAMYDNTSDTINRLSKRLDALSGLDTENYEMAIFNYAIGGHRYCHRDHFTNKADINPVSGNRKWLVLVYLEDNFDGGAVVFPILDIIIPKEKGSALAFPVLNNEGDYEDRTMHASCPVIAGSKWAFIKIYQEFPQMFKLPCYKK